VAQFVFYFPLLLLAFEVRRASGGAWKPDGDVQARDDVEGGLQERRPEVLICPLLRVVLLNMARNPSVYAGVLGVAWSFVTHRYVRLRIVLTNQYIPSVHKYKCILIFYDKMNILYFYQRYTKT
jgi:hypothetical protein